MNPMSHDMTYDTQIRCHQIKLVCVFEQVHGDLPIFRSFSCSD